ncbi:unnamed protein product [Schistosoma mattheei]|uniref:Coiled-coil domain-containing protein 39 n=1 Tax=Schistosoma mattheei TaxID=31246 RepID=A0AA85BLV5_9TREM|nr:unnamed protein product [Schistosoma mattheei]
MPSPNQSQISTVLAELGWNEAHAIPVANEENQKLIIKLEELQNQLFQRNNQLDIEQSKVKQLKNHMKNVQQEITYTNTLCNLRDKEINEELHQIKLIEREYERLIQENKKISQINNEIIEKKSFLETLFYQKRKELENSSVNIDSDKTSLENLMKTIGEHDEDMKIIEKYIKQDNTKIKELDLELEKLTNKRNELKSKLDTTYTNRLVDQVKFDSLSKEIKEAYAQRDSLIKQWENVINQMRQRDIQLDQFSQRLNQIKVQVYEQKQLNKEKLNFLHLQIENNSDVQHHLNEIIKNITQCKEDLQNTEMKRQDFHSELEALKRTVDKAVIDLEAARALSSQLKKEKEKKLQNLEKLKESIENSMKQLSYVTECKLTVEQYANEADKQLSLQELNHELYCKQLNKLRDDKFKVNQKYEELVHEEKLLKQSISGNETTKRNLMMKIEMLDAQLLKQQEVLYRQDFTIQSLERRIGKMTGEQNVEQCEYMENKINELTKELNERNNTVNLLTNQLRNLSRELHRIKREHELLYNKNDLLHNQLNTNELEMDIMLKEKEKETYNLQKLLIEKNLKKLQVNKLTKIYEQYTNKRYDLQKANCELNSTIKERTEQINLHQIMLNKQIKINTTENSQLNIEIQERKSKVDKLIKRYEIITALMAPPEGEETRNQAYYIIRAAQDKELLQRKGDTLDNEIRILEQEIVALENTLALMNGCNTVYRMSYSQLPNDAEEIKQQTELNEQIRVLNIKSRYNQSRLKELQDLYNTMQESSIRLDNDIELYKDQTKRLEIEVEHRMNEIEKQNTRLKRAYERMEKAKRLVKKEDQENIGPDIEARLTKELVTYTTNELLNRIKGDLTIYEQARAMLSTSGIPVNNLAISGIQQRRISNLSSSTKSLISSSSNRTTPTPLGSNPTSPDSSTKCSSKLCSPRSDSICDDDNDDGGGNDKCDNVQNSSRTSERNSSNDIRFTAIQSRKLLRPVSTTSIDLIQQTQLPDSSTSRSSRNSTDQVSKTKLSSGMY